MASTVLAIPNSSIQTSFLPQTSLLSIFKKKKPCYFVPNKVVSCKATNGNRSQHPTQSSNNNGDFSLNRFDRRDVLVGLGGLYGATNLASGNDPFALATPIPAPDLTNCKEVTITNETEGTSKTLNCCPPKDAKVTDFIPPQFSKIRYRPPAHLVDPNSDYFAKFTEAMRRMKALPDDDPRSFLQQANIHCTYCDGAYSYKPVDSPEQVIEVHQSWLFFPFHRLYLYFFERILGKLINDPDFAMPFWNWDAPAGMTIPAIYIDRASPLYNERRNVDHQPPVLIDLNYSGTDEETTPDGQITRNLKLMYKQMVSNSKKPTLFFGAAYRLGDEPNPGMGTIESTPHNNVHSWCGDKRQPNLEDMGILYSAGRDPVFYAHHGNIDRMWSIWKTLPGKNRNDLTSRDWLDASFVFYDENANLVRAKVRDCLDTRTLGYDYQGVDIPWLNIKYKPISRFAKKGKRNQAGAIEAETEIPKDGIVLDRKRSFKIPRENKSRNRREKEEEEEVLVLENIQVDRYERVKIDVYINIEDKEPFGPEYSEFAGSFSNLPHTHNHGKKLETNLTLGISDLLEDLNAEGDDNIVVTLVPIFKEGVIVTVGNIKIDFLRE